MKCRWGILSTAGIARKNWEAIFHAPNAELVAVASRDEAKAQAFIDECQREVRFPSSPMALGGYDLLLAREDIDAVYIPLPTGMRKDWVIQAAKAGKHVLCEKPCAVTYEDLKEMTEACRKAGVQFMDGVMFMHSARLPAMREALWEDGKGIGELRRIQSHFSFCAPDDFLQENIRVSSNLEPHGCLGDLGWYTIRMTLWALEYEEPVEVRARFLQQFGRGDSPEPVPLELSAELTFRNGVTAGFFNSFRTQNQQQVTFSGSEGYLHLSDFVLPFYDSELSFERTRSDFEVNGCQFNMARGRRKDTIAEYSNNHPAAQETRLFACFSELVLEGKVDPHWPDIALKTQRVMDACYASARNEGQPIHLD
ncbi:MAG: Gfo/Idh/MocA family oxidoreductase [Verrucomicrobiota bacterium]